MDQQSTDHISLWHISNVLCLLYGSLHPIWLPFQRYRSDVSWMDVLSCAALVFIHLCSLLWYASVSQYMVVFLIRRSNQDNWSVSFINSYIRSVLMDTPYEDAIYFLCIWYAYCTVPSCMYQVLLQDHKKIRQNYRDHQEFRQQEDS